MGCCFSNSNGSPPSSSSVVLHYEHDADSSEIWNQDSKEESVNTFNQFVISTNPHPIVVEDDKECVLVCDGKEYSVKIQSLCNISPYFQAMFNCDMRESSSYRVDLQQVDAKALEIIVKYFRTGEMPKLKNDEKLLTAIIETSHMWIMEELFEHCSECLASCSLNKKNLTAMWNFAKLYDIDVLLKKVMHYLATHFNEVSDSIILILTYHELKLILNDPGLNSASPETTLLFILKWAKQNLPQRQKLLLKLVSLIDLSSMSDVSLDFILKNDYLISSSKELSDCLVKTFALNNFKLIAFFQEKYRFYSIPKNEWSPIQPFVRAKVSVLRVLYITNCVYIFVNRHVISVYKLDFDTRLFVRLSNVMVTISDPRFAVLNGIVYVAGRQKGKRDQKIPCRNVLQSYNPTKNLWQVIKMKSDLCIESVVPLENRLYFYGVDEHLQKYCIEYYDIVTEQWGRIPYPERSGNICDETVTSCFGHLYLIRFSERVNGFEGSYSYEYLLRQIAERDIQEFIIKAHHECTRSSFVLQSKVKIFFKYNAKNNLWEEVPTSSGPEEIYHVLIGSYSPYHKIPFIYVVGLDMYLYQFDPERSEWKKLSPLPHTELTNFYKYSLMLGW